MKFYRYSDVIKKMMFFKKETDNALAKAQALQIREVKHEMARIFQIANRRIQNVEKSDVISPAVEKLLIEKNLKHGELPYSVFSYSKYDFTNKNEYIKALNAYNQALQFINNPTSSATGAKQYIKKLATQLSNEHNLRGNVSKKTLAERLKEYERLTTQVLSEIFNKKVFANSRIQGYVLNYKEQFDSIIESFNGDMNSIDFNKISSAVDDLMLPKDTDIDIWDL